MTRAAHPVAGDSARLGVLVPCTGARHLDAKLNDLTRLAPVADKLVVCFNGREADYAGVADIVARPRGIETVLSRSEPFNKSAALRAGLQVLGRRRVLYSDVDCLVRGEPDVEALRCVVAGSDLVSFLVLRRPVRRELFVRLALGRRALWSRLLVALGLHYLGVRGGGYVAGDMSDEIQDDVYSDDLFFPVEHAVRHGRRIVTSDALVFYELAGGGEAQYADKIPRLVYGSFQALRRTQSARVRASIVVEKLAKYMVVAFSPAIGAALLVALGLPLWGCLIFVPGARVVARTWNGICLGLLDRPPKW